MRFARWVFLLAGVSGVLMVAPLYFLEGQTAVRLLAGNAVLTSEGHFWLRQRRLMRPAFDRQHLAKLAPQHLRPAGVARSTALRFCWGPTDDGGGRSRERAGQR